MEKLSNLHSITVIGVTMDLILNLMVIWGQNQVQITQIKLRSS